MLPLAVDADVNHAIVRDLRRQAPGIDLVLSRNVLPEGTPDPDVLAWAAAHVAQDEQRDINVKTRG